MTLITKYRPQNWGEVIGNKELITSLVPLLKRGDSHAFIFTGPSGCGKTTIARLCAMELGAGEVIEIDAATNNGVEEVRELVNSNNYQPLKGGARVITIDECQAITTQAWRALLKSVEEPPPWLYWVFCTTEPNKVPAQIKTRCTMYEVETITPFKLIWELLQPVCVSERKKVDDNILKLCADLADGSPRKALSLLAQVIDCDTYEEAAATLHQNNDEDSPVIQLARMLIRRSPWNEARIVLNQLREENPETIRRILEAYITKVIIESTNLSVIRELTSLLEMLTTPIYDNHIAPIVVITSKRLLGEHRNEAVR